MAKSKGSETSNQIRVNNVRLSFPCMFSRESYNGVEGKFSAVGIIDDKSWGHGPKGKEVKIGKYMAAANLKACEAKWPGKGKKMLDQLKRHKSEHALLRDGNGKVYEESGEVYDGYEGNTWFKASSANPVNVIDSEGNLATAQNKSSLSGTVPYSGCRVDMIIDVWAQDSHSKKKINAQLQVVRFREDDEPLGNSGRTMSTDAARDAFADDIDDSQGETPENDAFDEGKEGKEGKKGKKGKKGKNKKNEKDEVPF